MIYYAPWSPRSLREAIERYATGVFSILDVEVGGACNSSCIYCDSPDRHKVSSVTLDHLERFLRTGNIRWLFVCGLGEPSAGDNRAQFLGFLERCAAHNVTCSTFTNALGLGDDILRFVESGCLHLLVKCDSLDPDKIDEISGNGIGDASVRGLRALEKYVRIDRDSSNIGLSIVPTTMNVNHIPDVVKYCLDKGFFPLIGDLEDSGMQSSKYKSLKLAERELRKLKETVVEILGAEYEMPICPAVIGGIHIDADARVVVDRATGLSCHWFWLLAPDKAVVCEVDATMDYHTVAERIIGYRNAKVSDTERLLRECEPVVLGGCGGDIRTLLTEYLRVQKAVHGS